MQLFRELNQAGTTIVQVAHSDANAAVGNRVIHLRDGEGMRVLAADDQPDVLEEVRLLLKREQMAMVPATSPGGVLAALQAEDFDAALIDLNYARDTTSGKEGRDLLTPGRALHPLAPIGG